LFNTNPNLTYCDEQYWQTVYTATRFVE
jgi:hypothetical protein